MMIGYKSQNNSITPIPHGGGKWSHFSSPRVLPLSGRVSDVIAIICVTGGGMLVMCLVSKGLGIAERRAEWRMFMLLAALVLGVVSVVKFWPR